MSLKTKQKCRVRFAPSPTGPLHIGSARTALFNYLFAKKNQGEIFLRIDDTDKERSKAEYEKNIFDALNWLSFTFDEIFKQSNHLDIYTKQIEALLATGQVYISPNETGGERKEVIRFKNPNKEVTFNDLIRGQVTFNTTELGDFIVAKSITEPLYHLASVIDDQHMGITHIIRGEDHISNTPRQILLNQAIGGVDLTYAHIPLILNADRSKLSKRTGSLAVTEYQERGYLPEAMINFLALLGWSPQAGEHKTNQEIFTLTELINLFSINHIGKSGAIFNQDKLDWINREQIKKLPESDLLVKIKNNLPKEIQLLPQFSSQRLEKIIPTLIERISVLNDINNLLLSGEYNFFFTRPIVNKELLMDTQFLSETKNIIKKIKETDFTADNIKNSLWDFATVNSRQKVLWPLRVSLTGQKKSPDPFTVAAIIGKEETLTRIDQALALQ